MDCTVSKILAKAILFDVDGTLFDSRDAFYFMIRDVFEGTGWSLPKRDDVVRLVGRTNDYIANELIPREMKRPEFVKRWMSRVERLWIDQYLPTYVKLYPGAKQGLTELRRRGFKLAVVTNGSAKEIPLYLKQGQVDHLIDLVITADDVPTPKPSPEPIVYACDRLGIGKVDCLYVGDTWMDAESASRAGVRCVLTTWGVGDIEELRKYPHVAIVRSFEELLDLVELRDANP
jgi:phosphoglycolate phosphatase